MARKIIDKNIRYNIWTRYWGNITDGQCWVCGKLIDIQMFDCGHIISVSNKGDDNLINLVPICRGCNLGMKEENLLDYKKRYYSHIYVKSIVQPESPDVYIKEKEIISRPTRMTAKPVDNDTTNQRQGKMTAQSVNEDFSEKDKKERYGEYSLAVQEILPDIKEMISSNKNKEVKFKVTEIAEDLGKDFIDKNPTTIYWGLRYALFKEGIVVGSSGKNFLTMRQANPDDKLPPSLAKYLDSEKISEDISNDKNVTKKKLSSRELVDMVADLPSPLANSLEVYFYVANGMARSDATNFVAKRKDVTASTISSSYTRSLDKSTSEVDLLMQHEDGTKFKKFLIARFPEHIDQIKGFFDNI